MRSFADDRQSARTRAIGLRREPQPPMPTVMPSCTSATISSMVTRLSGTTRYSILLGWQIVGARACARSNGASPSRQPVHVPECPADGRSSLRRTGRDRHRRVSRHRPGDRAAVRRGGRARAGLLPPRARDRCPTASAFVAADVREPEQIDAVIAACVERFGRVDVLVNNAGGSPPADSATASPRFTAGIIALEPHRADRVRAAAPTR